MKGLTASIWRHNRKKKKKMANNSSNTYWPRVYEQFSREKIVSNSVTPYKDVAHSGRYTSFASRLRRFKRKKYNIGIFEKIKKDEAFCYLCTDIDFALWYLEEVYHSSAKEICYWYAKPWKNLNTKSIEGSVTPYK